MDGFLAAFTSISSFEWRGDGSLRAWLRKVMVNKCLSWLRKKRLRFEAIDAMPDSNAPYEQDGITSLLNAKAIINMVQALPDGCRTVFNLYVFEEMPHADIATLLGISENTSKSQLHRARTLLKEKIMQPEKSLL